MYKTWIKPFLKDTAALALEMLFPIKCFRCKKEGGFLCAACQSRLPTVHQICIVCKKPSLAGLTHSKCQTPHCIDQLLCLYDYKDELVSGLIIRGKYYFIPGIFSLFGELAADRLKAEFPLLLSPRSAFSYIPLHIWRERWRGFNQSQVFCQSLAKALGLWPETMLKRTLPTRTQKNLGKERRKKNITGAFCLLPKSEVKNRQILLLDDVATTGYTLMEAGKVLKSNGAARVVCLVIARE